MSVKVPMSIIEEKPIMASPVAKEVDVVEQFVKESEKPIKKATKKSTTKKTTSKKK